MRTKPAPLYGYAAALFAGITLTISPASAADITVLSLADSGPGSLRQAVLDAAALPGADTIRFADGLTGAIVLTSGQLSITDQLTIEGPGAGTLAVSGTPQSRVFRISGGAQVTIAGLTIREGRAVGSPGDGGGILNMGSTLALVGVALSNNQAVGSPGAIARGGAIANLSGATLTVTDCRFAQNQAVGGGGSGGGNGGGIYNLGSRLTVRRSTFSGNQAVGGINGGAAAGGAIYNMNPSTAPAIITDSTIAGNQAIAADGIGGNGFGRGGGIYNLRSSLSVENCVIEGNLARGGSGNTIRGPRLSMGAGAGIFNADGAVLFLAGSTILGNQAVGGSHNTSTGGNADIGTAFGGGLNNVGEAAVVDTVFAENEVRGGDHNFGDGVSYQFVGTATGGAIATSARNTSGQPVRLTLHNVTMRHNRAIGGIHNTDGTFAGTGIGGGLASNGSNSDLPASGGSMTSLSNTRVEHNLARGGSGATGVGGGVANTLGGIVAISGGTVAHNRAEGGFVETGGDGGDGLGGGIFNGGASTHPSNPGAAAVLTMWGTVLTFNHADGGAAGTLSGRAGSGAGGGIWSGSSLAVSGSSLARNMAHGGAGADRAGSGLGGGLYVGGGTASVAATTINNNRAVGGDGASAGAGGNGFGGGAFNEAAASLRLEHSTVTDNHANGGSGDGIGGGVYTLGTFEFHAFTVIRKNHASTSHDDISGM